MEDRKSNYRKSAQQNANLNANASSKSKAKTNPSTRAGARAGKRAGKSAGTRAGKRAGKDLSKMGLDAASVATVTDLLRLASLRPTRSRIEIATHLFGSDLRQGKRLRVHVSADVLWQQLLAAGKVFARATVYNTLNDFATNGLVSPIDAGNGTRLYDTDMMPHDHALDPESGEVFNIEQLKDLRSRRFVDGYRVKQVLLVLEKD